MSSRGGATVGTREALDVRTGGGELHLVRDLLDDLLVDRNRDPMGRVDGIVLSITEGRQPRVECLESGVPVAAGRVHRRLGRWARAVARRWGLRRGRPMRVAWARVVKVGIETELDLVADETEALSWEHWLLRRIVGHIPSLKPRNDKKNEKNEKKEKEK